MDSLGNKIICDLTKGIIYKIQCLQTGETYYGSTKQTLTKRKHIHQSKSNTSSSKQIIDRGNWKIESVEEIFFKHKNEMLIREKFYIQKARDSDRETCVNKNLPITTIWEKSEQQSETMRKWYIKNKRNHLITCTKYQETHKEQHAQAMQRYQQKNLERIRIYQRAYRQKQHDEAILKLNENILLKIDLL